MYNFSRYYIILGFNKFIVGLFFFSLGMLFRRFKQVNIFNAYYIAIIATIWLICAYYNGKVSLYGFNLGNYLLYIISGISGTVIYFCLMGAIKKRSLISEYASNSVFIICTHIVLVYYISISINSTFGVGSIKMDLVIILMTLLMLFFYLPVCRFINKYAPIVNGRLS